MNISQFSSLDDPVPPFPSPTDAKQSSDLPPLPNPPFITTLPTISNLRSIGDLATTTPPGRTKGHILRSGDPSGLTPESLTLLRKVYGIRIIFDLRCQGELSGHSLPAPNPIEGLDLINCHVPVYENRDVSPAELAKTVAAYGSTDGVEGFVQSYCRILDAGVNAYRRVFGYLLEYPGMGVLVHCTAGKDRTGVLVALILKLVGVSDDVVADEYALTEQGLREWKEGVVRLLLRSEELKGDEVKIRRMLSARREVMVAFLHVLQEREGGAEGYLKGKLGFSTEEVQRIREGLVE